MKNAYVTAFTNSIIAGIPVEDVLLHTKALLKKRGHQRLWPQILRAVLRELQVMVKNQAPQVTVAKEGGVSSSIIKQALTVLGVESDSYVVVVDETLIGGFTARFQGLLIDSSYKRSLVSLYQKITK